ncbi:MAG: Rne/Rng family ribonuclease [Alphaproteobacteria bacterium]|nr:Rne/Rng family ribonuclease [Alphaproteobacteria bacterium]
MAKRMLIDATHPEETRVVVLNGPRLEEFDFESSTKHQVKGNIYLAKVTRVEPSLQAAFVEYGGNRQGFLAFSEIHPDYYRIPVEDRHNAGTERAEPAPAPEASGNGDEAPVPLESALPEPVDVPESLAGDEDAAEDERATADAAAQPDENGPDRDEPAGAVAEPVYGEEDGLGAEQPAGTTEFSAPYGSIESPGETQDTAPDSGAPAGSAGSDTITFTESGEGEPATGDAAESQPSGIMGEEDATGDAPEGVEGGAGAAPSQGGREPAAALAQAETVVMADVPAGAEDETGEEREADETETVETLGGDEFEDSEADADVARQRFRTMRHYKIQEVIKRRQIMLVQVTKEERGNKGAALTTYLSLAGRYCVLMPNTGRGGGVSRKITNMGDRRRLKEILEELDIPEGMGVIVRTAGSERSKPEIKRDYEYLLRLWNEIRDLTLRSTAPALIYEEGNLIKRSIRDLYTRDIDEVLVEGEDGYRMAKAFMRMLMPSHAKRVQPYRDPQIGLLHRFQVESQIDAIHSPVAQLRSGGYLVINQTEALVAIDVNSGRSTRERNIEETALRTNLEAAEEIARQLRLRDLAGLIVIDFIDMEEHRNQGAVERRLKEALKNDRARIQVGRISPFGLLEMSRQRLRPSLTETSTQPCPHCGGTGLIRSTESTALHVLRSIEEEGIRRRSAEICIYVPTAVALYILNQKRESLIQIEQRYGVKVMVARDDALIPPAFRLERLRAFGAGEAPPPAPLTQIAVIDDEDEEEEFEEAESTAANGAERDSESEEERGRRRRRRRRRRHEDGRHTARERAEGGDEGDAEAHQPEAGEGAGAEDADEVEPQPAVAARRQNGAGEEGEGERSRGRRGRRGGRRRPRREDSAETSAETGAEAGTEPPAAENIEIVHEPAPSDFAAHQAEAAALEAVSEAVSAWPVETGLETASVAALAGDDGPSAAPAASGETAEPPSAPTAEAEEGVPFVSPAERELETAEAAASPAPGAAGEASPPNVQTITEKPANPRKGWWQRLIQP